MAVGVLEIDLEGAATVRNLRVALEAVSPVSLAAFLESTAHTIIINRMKGRFASEGDDASGPWAVLSGTSESFRENQGFGKSHPINERTGQMREWLENGNPDVFFEGGGVDYVFPGEQPGDPWLLEKLETAQTGKDKPPTVPRPVVAMNENDHIQVREALAFYINGRMNGSI